MIKKIFLLFTIFILSTSLYASKNIQWNLAISVPSTFSPISSASFILAKTVNEMSNGRFIIKIDGKEKQQTNENILDLVQAKTYEIGHTSSSAMQNNEINTIWFRGTPFGMTSKEQYTWYYYGQGQKYMSKVFDQYGVLSFPGGSLDTQMFGWSTKKISNLTDLEGLKINQNGIISEILSFYKVKLQDIPLSQNLEAFKTAKLDIINGISPSIDIKMGFHKVAKYYYKSWDQPSSHMQFIVNKKAFESLPKNYQSILTAAIKIAATDVFIENFYTSAKALKKIQEEFPNIQILSLPNAVLQGLKKSTTIVFEQYAKENKLFKEIYNDQKEFLKLIRPLSILGEYSYIQDTTTLK